MFIHLSVCDLQNGRVDVSSIISRMLRSDIKTADSAVIMSQAHSQIKILSLLLDICKESGSKAHTLIRHSWL